MIFEAKAGAVDTHLLTADACDSHWYFQYSTIALLIRIQYQLRMIIKMRMELTVQQRRRIYILGSQMKKVSGHQPSVRHRHGVNGITPYPKTRK